MTDSTNAKRTPLRHRLPVRLRHHWKLLVTAIAVCVVVALVFGASMVRPYITSDLVSETVITQNIEGDTDLFDDGGEHTIDITFNQTEYDEMIATFQNEGEKEYIRADITIDGTLIENVGLRLKGNSTLSSLSGGMGGGGMGGEMGGEMGGGPGENEDGDQPDAAAADDATADDAAADTDADAAADADAEADDAEQGGMGGGGGGMIQLSEDSPEDLPWLISFDEYEEGRAYEGMTEIALRPATSGSDVALNEALALEMTAEAGQTTQDYSFTSVSVNGGDSVARIVLDSPDAPWADELGNGVLYKARADGSLDYLGEDPTEYEDSFKQINSEGGYDLQPVMNLLKFLNESTDEEFAEQLDDYIDAESYAEYLAMQEILSNNDAMDGPGNNYYLWYDADEEKFTILSWDLNMSLSGGMGGGGGMGGDMGAGTTQDGTTQDGTTQDDATGDAADGTADDAASGGMPQMPDGAAMGEMGEMPEGMQGMPQDGEMPQMPDGTEMGDMGEMPEGGMGGMGGPGGDEDAEGGGGPGGGSGSSILKERFLDNEEFRAMYDSAYADLYDQLIASGYALDTLDELTERAVAAGDTGAETLSESIRSTLESVSEEAPEPSSGMGGGMGGGRPDDADTQADQTDQTDQTDA